MPADPETDRALLERMRAAWSREPATHYTRCEEMHADCAVHALCDALERALREADEALCTAEGPGTLRELAAAFLDSQCRRAEAEADAEIARAATEYADALDKCRDSSAPVRETHEALLAAVKARKERKP